MFVHLEGNRELLEARASARAGHFMPVSLLESQLRTLEPLGRGEAGMTIRIDATVDEIAAAVAERLASDPGIVHP